MTPVLAVAATIAAAHPEPVPLPTDAPVYNTTFTPDGRTLVLTRVRAGGASEIVSYERRGDAWVESDYFTGALDGRDAGDGAFTPDGDVFLFVEHRDVYLTRRRARAEWTEPIPLSDAINTPDFEAYPRVAPDGSLCFTRDTDQNWDIYLAPANGDAWGPPRPLPPPINTPAREHDAMVTPDGNAIIFVRRGDPLGAGATDLFIARRTQDGWADPEPLPINSPAIDGSPCLSPDGRWLYFTSSRPLPGSRAHRLRLWRVDTASVGL